MFKRTALLTAIVFSFISIQLKAQRFIPTEVSIHSFSGVYAVKGISNEDLFGVTPDFNWITDIDLPKEYFNLNRNDYESGRSIDLGFRLNSKAKSNSTMLHVGVGSTSGFRLTTGYSFDEWNSVDTFIRNGKMLVLDSVSSISSRSTFNSNTIYNLRLGLERDVFTYKRLSFRLGLLTQFSLYAETESNFSANSFYAYQIRPSFSSISRMKGGEIYSWSKEEQDPFSFSVMIPLTASFQLSKDKPVLKNLSIVLSALMGQRYYSQSDLPSFKAQIARYSIGIKYQLH